MAYLALPLDCFQNQGERGIRGSVGILNVGEWQDHRDDYDGADIEDHDADSPFTLVLEAAKISELKVGNGMDEGVTLGHSVFDERGDVVLSLLLNERPRVPKSSSAAAVVRVLATSTSRPS